MSDSESEPITLKRRQPKYPGFPTRTPKKIRIDSDSDTTGSLKDFIDDDEEISDDDDDGDDEETSDNEEDDEEIDITGKTKDEIIDDILVKIITPEFVTEMFPILMGMPVIQPPNTKFLPMSLLQPPPQKKQKQTQLQKDIDKIRKEVAIINNNDMSLSLEEQILISSHSLQTKAYLCNKLLEVPSFGGDKDKIITYIKEALKIPVNVYKEVNISDSDSNGISNFLLEARKILNDEIYGMNNTKEEILDYLTKIITKQTGTPTILALEGPPGVGKTKISRALGKILDKPFFQVSLGGMTDSSILIGHDSTYVGGKQGKIASFLQRAKCMDPIILLDEMDKIGSENHAIEVSGVLTHLLDETQNNDFQDLYFDNIPIDLSRVLWIVTFNVSSKIDNIVLNRMKIIKINGYSDTEKVCILKDYYLPFINHNNWNISEGMLSYIVKHKSEKEEGVRNAKKNLATIINRLDTIKLLQTNNCCDSITDNFSYKDLVKTLDVNHLILTERLIDKLLSNGKKYGDEPWRSMYL